jgi:signal peptide peptidase SppA
MPDPVHNPTCRANHMGLWAIEPRYLARAVESIKAGTWPARAADGMPGDASKPARLLEISTTGIGVIRIAGAMMKGYSKYADVDTLEVRRAVRTAVADERVKAILLLIDSPGGATAGTMELADDVAAANRKKPTYAFLDDLGASAAYWVASQARRISTNVAGEVGSIGVYAVVHETAKMAEMEGVTVHVLSTGPYKGAFVAGTAVLPEHLAYLQERVDEVAGFFFKAVREGRGLDDDEMAAVSDGRVFGAAEAKRLGLVDRIESLESALDGIQKDLEDADARARAAKARSRVAQSMTGE